MGVKLPKHVRAMIPAAELEDTRPRAERMVLTLPFPPSLNDLYPTIVTREGKMRRVKSARGKRYAEIVSQTVALWMNAHGMRPPAPPYRLTLVAYPPQDGQKHDISNLVKCPEDSAMTAIGGDDNDVHELSVRKALADGYPRIELTLESARALGVTR